VSAIAFSVLGFSGPHLTQTTSPSAGQPQFYLSHELFLPDPNSVFVLVVSMREAQAAREKHLLYWLSFLKIVFDASETRPVVHVVFSHSDGIRASEADAAETWATRQLKGAHPLFGEYLDVRSDTACLLDCHDKRSAAMSELRKALCASHEVVLERMEETPSIVSDVMHHLPELRERYAAWPFVPKATFTDFISRVLLVKASPSKKTFMDRIKRTPTKVFKDNGRVPLPLDEELVDCLLQ